VAYQVVGEGPLDLLLAPGFISHLDLQWTMPTFASFVEHLTSFARVILFDKRGTGLSDPSPDAARFDQRVEDIEAVMNAAGSGQAVLFGMSEGGPLATLFATTHPDRTSKLVLYGTFASGSSLDRGLLRRFENAVDHWGTGLTAEVFMSPESQRMFARSYFGLFERASCSPGMAPCSRASRASTSVRCFRPSVCRRCSCIDGMIRSRHRCGRTRSTARSARRTHRAGRGRSPSVAGRFRSHRGGGRRVRLR
jgi:pimeloyl-ACP methyl ester carboxylesterase